MADKTQPQNNDIVVEVKELWKIFGRNPDIIIKTDLRTATCTEIQEKTGCVVAMRGISFKVKRGELFVIMGLSGSGKSTLIRCLLRLVEPTSGSIFIDGEDICRYREKQLRDLRRKKIGMVFQHFGLLPHQSVIDNVAYGLKVRGIKKKERRTRAEEVVARVGLKGWGNYLPGALSGGMQQRVGIARALANDPEILLMDEPFSGLDPLIRRQIQDELVTLQAELHKTILFVTHDVNEALKLGNRIAIMRDGAIIQIGTPEEVVTSPANDYVREFVQDASPAKVVTAGSIMEQPPVLLHDWQTPITALHTLTTSQQNAIFVIDRMDKLVGLVTVGSLMTPFGERGTTLREIIEPYVTTCTPDTILENLLVMAANSNYPIPVVDETGRFLGVINQSTLMLRMVQEKVDNGKNAKLNT